MAARGAFELLSEETFPGNGVKGESNVPQELLGFDEGKWCVSCPSLPLIEITVELRAEKTKLITGTTFFRRSWRCATPLLFTLSLQPEMMGSIFISPVCFLKTVCRLVLLPFLVVVGHVMI